ncbi:hypothetical protein C8R44DRAFT_806538 [Mycena epipterygia]|nr:hypothetical protein C8R44DRAFT_806538 [Mycena epipterygia]
MHTTSTTIPTVQRTADAPLAVANAASTTKEAVPVNHSGNGPTCAHCGWRGGGHARFLLRLAQTAPSSSRRAPELAPHTHPDSRNFLLSTCYYMLSSI